MVNNDVCWSGQGAAGTFLWLAWSPWLMLRRATFMPSSASLKSRSRSQVAGPMVHTTCKALSRAQNIAN